MGWTEAQLYDTSPRYFFNAMRAWNKKQEAEVKVTEHWRRFHLELNRDALFGLLNIQLEQKDRRPNSEWFPFPWDEIPKPKEPGAAKKEADKFIKEMGYDQGIPIDEFFK